MRNPLHVLLISSALALSLTACGKDEENPNRLVASGHVEATDVRISTEVGGRLEAFPGREGDAVRAGHVLARSAATHAAAPRAGSAAPGSFAGPGRAAASGPARCSPGSKRRTPGCRSRGRGPSAIGP